MLSPGSARVGLPDSLANPKLEACRVLDEAIARQTSKLFSFPVIVLEIYTHDRGSCKFVSFGSQSLCGFRPTAGVSVCRKGLNFR